MSSRAGKKRLCKVQPTHHRSTSTIQQPSIRRHLNSANVKPPLAKQDIVPNSGPSALPPVSDFNFQFTHDLCTALEEIDETKPPGNTPMPGDICLSRVDEDLEDVLVNHRASGKVSELKSPPCRVLKIPSGPKRDVTRLVEWLCTIIS